MVRRAKLSILIGQLRTSSSQVSPLLYHGTLILPYRWSLLPLCLMPLPLWKERVGERGAGGDLTERIRTLAAVAVIGQTSLSLGGPSNLNQWHWRQSQGQIDGTWWAAAGICANAR